ncbi:uncharacterized protein BX663DRAFT_505261 [Cokeromyces recurvatus]|uniref:uncharacterized protein n=1 Tax=Cokeromyces recurvatus TaxID=90255 RepID=UPI00221E6DA2|nr:uncharacterized protein BX663DRAFT_505261 [Cokeromyces recurvatus]KAI7903795.1 hypothetical protein BX663DRAFT_505261 [Cokeromyces recurvatus]
MEDADEPSGDELDDISARDIAMARYKRNHDYLSEIFTPYNAAHIVTPALDISQSKEELEKQIEECKERDIQQKKKMEEKLASIESEQEKFWKCINQLKNATTLESIEEVTKNITKELGIEIKHRTNNVNILSIPELEKQEEKEKEALLLQQQQQQQALIENANNQRQQTMEEVISNNIASQGMDMYFNQREDEAETADSFFNEMVNTDDDPAVSEFLNTE